MSHAARLRLVDADFEEIGDQRRAERRRSERRAQSLRLDPLFAATLISQVTAPEPPCVSYGARKRLARAGLAFDLRA